MEFIGTATATAVADVATNNQYYKNILYAICAESYNSLVSARIHSGYASERRETVWVISVRYRSDIICILERYDSRYDRNPNVRGLVLNVIVTMGVDSSAKL